MLTDTEKTVILVAPVGGNTETIHEFAKSVHSSIDDGPASVAIDCSQLNHVTSSHVSMLWGAYLQCSEAQIPLTILSPPQNLIRILKLLDIDDLFSYAADSDSDVYTDEFTTDAFSINIAMRQFTDLLERRRVSDTAQFELKTIFYEVATNIRAHSGLGEGDTIHFTVRPKECALTMVFVDSGVPFDLTSVAQPIDPEQAARKGKKRGFGIAMITKLADRLSYVRRPEGTNALTVEKRWSC